MINKETITTNDILAIHEIKDIFVKQAKINEIEYGFANNSLQFATSDDWAVFYELVHRKTNLSHETRKKAFFNAYDSHINSGR